MLLDHVESILNGSGTAAAGPRKHDRLMGLPYPISDLFAMVAAGVVKNEEHLMLVVGLDGFELLGQLFHELKEHLHCRTASRDAEPVMAILADGSNQRNIGMFHLS